MRSRSNRIRNLSAALALLNLSAVGSLSVAGDKTWDNGSADSLWNTSSLNWTGTAWNNAAGDGAIFGGAGLGPINVPGVISVNSLNFSANGYTINGAGSLDFVNGTSTATTGVINVASGTTQINVPLTSAFTAIQKLGPGVLELSAPTNITASFPINTNINGSLNANVIIGPAPTGQSPVGGTIRLMNSSVLPAATSVAIGSGSFLDIGSNNQTLGQLIFQNQFDPGSIWPSNGVIGSGTLRVTGEINVIGVFGGNFSNTIATNLDLGGGTQIVRNSSGTAIAGAASLVISGTISNGSITKTLGYNQNGVYGSGLGEGIAFLGNNTYVGATIHNGGNLGSIATGTNASSSLKVVNGSFTLQGANGAFGSATSIQLFSGGSLVLDNNVAFGAAGNVGVPFIPAANNNNRIPDAVTIEVRDSNLTYRGLAGSTSSETYGGLNITGGHAVFNITPNNLGTATVTATGNLALDSRATLQVTTTTTGTGNAGNLIGGNARALFNGSVPGAVGGIIPRIIGPNDFVSYDAVTGITPLPAASYSPTFAANANVALAASANTNTITINALKSNATLTTTINAGQTLSVTTGMILSANFGTHTVAATGTLDFGSTPGVFFGTNTVNSAITGSQGLLNPNGTLILTGDLSGLTGTVSNTGTGTLNLNTNTFAGVIENRRGTLNIGVPTLSAGGAIVMGVSANDVDLLPANPSLSIANAGVNAVINRDIVVNNGATNAAGLTLNRQGYIASLAPLSNTTGSQTMNGNITLNTSLNFQGGGGGGTGATTFGGTISGPGTFVFANGRANFTGTLSNAGGMIIAAGGFTGIANFSGTGSGNGPIILNGGSNSNTGFSYLSQTNLYAGPITVQNAVGANAPTIRVLGNSTLNNTINLNGDVFVDVATGVTGGWAGPLGGNSRLTKNNTGTLVLANNANTHTGPVTVNAGVLAVNGNLPISTNAVNVNSGGTLGGSGTISRTVTVASGGSLAPGNSPGNLTVDGNVTLSSGSSFRVELNGTNPGVTHDLLTVNGTSRTVAITGSILNATTTSSSLLPTDQMFVVVLSDTTSSLTGTFNGIAQDGTVNIIGFGPGVTYSAQVSYTGDSGSSTITGGNDIVLYNFTAAVPEPTTIALFGVLGAGTAGGWYYRRRRSLKALDAKFSR